MFPQTIRKRSTFLEVSNKGSCFRTKGVVTLCHKTSDARAFAGYTASKKVGNAVSRNFAKRRLRSLVREFHQEFDSGCFFVFIATRKTVDLEFSRLKSDFAYSLKKAKESEVNRAR